MFECLYNLKNNPKQENKLPLCLRSKPNVPYFAIRRGMQEKHIRKVRIRNGRVKTTLLQLVRPGRVEPRK